MTLTVKLRGIFYPSMPGVPFSQLPGGKEPVMVFDHKCTVLETGCGASVSVVWQLHPMFLAPGTARTGLVEYWTGLRLPKELLRSVRTSSESN